jgi:beta-glucosidase
MAKAIMTFPTDFRWGTATAAHQVEGNNTNNDWWQWEQQSGAILLGHQSGKASDWWENAEQDLDAAAEMGTNAHRLSLEWSRIEPEPSVFDENAIARYRQILQAMHDRGIEPMVTLHHFSNPIWLLEKGAWETSLVVEFFQRFVTKVVDALGDLIPKWVTINEPMVYLYMRYLDKKFPPPPKTGLRALRKAFRHLLMAHAVAYHAVKDKYPKAEVGVAKNNVIFEPQSNNLLSVRWNNYVSWLFNDAWMDCLKSGSVSRPFGGGKIEGLADSFDFIGLNYYTRFYTKFPPFGGFIAEEWKEGAVVSDGNYGEVYSAGIFQTIQKYYRAGKPIYITENGVPDADDDIRPSYIVSHLREVWRAISYNYPVMGYYHWSLVDNFEWDRGWTQRFGLIALDPETQERTMRDSGKLYGEICRANALSSDMTARYAPQLMPVLFPDMV